MSREYRAIHPVKPRLVREAEAGGYLTRTDIRRMWKEQAAQCAYCGCQIFKGYSHIDHIIPLAKGGSNGPDNRCLACPPCNHAKRDLMPEDWLRTRPDLQPVKFQKALL